MFKRAVKAWGLVICVFLASNINFAAADWRKDVGTFRIGMVVGNDVAGSIARAEPFRLAISEALGINVEIFAARNYRGLINAHVASRIEYAIYSATAYATAWKICECVEPLVIPRSSDGTPSYKSVVISSESGPQSVSDLADFKTGALSKDSFAGNKFAAFELGAEGIRLPEKLAFANSGEDVIAQFVAGKHDALIGWSSLNGDPATGYSRGTLRLIAQLNGGKITPYRMIWSSSPIPHRPHAIRKSLDGEAKKLLRTALVNMFDADPVAYDSIEPIFGGGFVAARHSQFLPIISYVETLAPEKDEKDTIAVEE